MSIYVGTLVGQPAPDFSQPAVLEDGSIVDHFSLSSLQEGNDHYTILFFYPLAFTFVCPSELISINKRIESFKLRNTKIVAVSVDSQFALNAWRNTSLHQGGIGPIQYPLVSDVGHDVCRSYGVEHPASKVALRATFLIDKQGIVRVQMVNDLAIGRDVDEMLRLVSALQHYEQHGEVCPAGWREGRQAMTPSAQGVADYLVNHENEL